MKHVLYEDQTVDSQINEAEDPNFMKRQHSLVLFRRFPLFWIIETEIPSTIQRLNFNLIETIHLITFSIVSFFMIFFFRSNALITIVFK